MGSKRGQSTTVVKNLPSYADPFVQDYLARAATLSRTAYAPYTAQTYASQNQDEKDAITALAARGRGGNLTITKATTLIKDTLDGLHLPGTRAAFQTVLGNVLSKPANSFGSDVLPKIGASAYLMGDPLNQNVAASLCVNTSARYLGRAEAEAYSKNYDTERANMGVALEHGLVYAGESSKDAELLRMAGLYAREYSQGGLEDAFKVWHEQQLGEVKRLEILGNAIRALVGTQEADTGSYYRVNPMMTAAGGAVSGAVAGAMIGSAIGAGVPGAIVGAVIGGVAGYAAGS